jgi:hypothetical protein
MSMSQPFTPAIPTVNATSGAGSSSAAVAMTKVANNRQVLVTSASGGTQGTAFIRFGASTVQADATDMPILPGTAQIFTLGAGQTHFAVFAAAATQVYVTSGNGE